ncbi:MAG TPA: ABC transporter permease [Gaiellaceae bacterium]|jgi:lipopolysaccharide transport system permease protein|nr:ABC transporter permease [Gaiellaceae bacterium]
MSIKAGDQPAPPPVSIDPPGGAGGGTGPSAPPATLVIAPTRGWVALRLGDIWAYRELLYFLTWRDVKVRYKQTVLGVLWAVLQPLLMMLIFVLLLGRVAGLKSQTPGVPYPLIVFAGLTPWTLFSAGISAAAVVLVTSANLVTKVYFPRLILPIASAGSYLVDLLLSLVVLLGLMAVYGIYPTWRIVVLPGLILLTLIAAIGIGTWLTALNARYRDVRYVVPFMVQIWLFLSPIAYTTARVPEEYRWLYDLNPMVAVIEGFRWALLGLHWDLGWQPVLSVIVSFVFLVSGAFFFRRVERTFADEL